LANNLINNCPVTADDAKRAIMIYGPDTATLQGKMTKHPGQHVPTFTPVQVPQFVLEHHKNVTLCQDFFYVQGLPFLHTISRKLQFRTVTPVPNRKKDTMLKETKRVVNLYEHRGFEIMDIHADNEFECIRDDIRPIELDIVPVDEHVGEVERSIRTIKERARCTIHGLPYRRYPKAMIIDLVHASVRSLNQVPAQDGISDRISPLTLVTGQGNVDYNQLKLCFGSYVQVFEDNTITNTTAPRSIAAIALTISPNENGSYRFMNLLTGKVLHRRKFTELPITQDVIHQVEHLASLEKQPPIKDGCPQFGWTAEDTIDDEEIDDDEDANDDDVDANDGGNNDDDFPDNDGDDDPTNGQGPDDGDNGAAPNDDDTTDHDGGADENNVVDNDGEAEHVTNDIDAHRETGDADANTDDERPTDALDGAQRSACVPCGAEFGTGRTLTECLEDRGAPYLGFQMFDGTDNPIDAVDTDPIVVPDQAVAHTHGHNLRGNRRNYGHRLDHIMDDAENGKTYDASFLQDYEPEHKVYGTQFLQQAIEKVDEEPRDLHEYVCNYMFTQMTADAGIKKHGQLAVEALMVEFAQLDGLKVFKGLHPGDLTTGEKREALRAINLIKEKRCGKIKGRTVADGSKQREKYSHQDTSSPTVSNDALMMTLVIDALERREVATADVPGAYLHADMDDFTVLKLVGQSVDILCQANPDYKQYVTEENGKKVLYLQLLKALYGCIKSGLLWYELFSGTLKDMGFVLNPYDPCVANATIEGKQCTVCWYVDDLKVSHVKLKVVLDILNAIELRFGGLTITTGNQHTYLGMDITFKKKKGTLQIRMKDYIKEAIVASKEDVSRGVSTPATRALFDIDEDSERLQPKQSDLYHHIVAKLLYVSTRSRLDIQLTIGFLCTRVSCSTKEDWAKLKRLLQYLNRTLDDYLTLGADNMTSLNTWVDASYAVHRDMKSHTGGAISLGIGAVMSKSGKQKLNVKSSTEAEIVAASDYAPNTFWAARFLEHQGYALLENNLHQDNQSAMKMEINGRSSCGQKSRHIDIRYFFLKDRVARGEVDILYCPTEMMIADFFTKPLQGALFRKLKSVIMGEIDVKTFLAMSSGPKERVGRELPAATEKLPVPTMKSGPYGLTYYGQTEKHARSTKRVTYADAARKSSE
jgi:hypothetical protein